jgi:hypothetical protein
MLGLEAAVFGGRTEHGPTNALYMFHSATRVWSELRPADPAAPCPRPRYGHAACLAGKTMYVYGGTDGTAFFNDLWAFDTATRTWKEVTPKAGSGSPPAVAWSAMCALDSFKIVLTGGRDASGVVECNMVFDAMQSVWSLVEGTKVCLSHTLHPSSLSSPLSLSLFC